MAECPKIGDASLEALASGCSGLEQLAASKAIRVTDRGVIAIARACPRLLVLGISQCKITDAALKEVAQNCKALEQLDVKGCAEVTDDGLISVGSLCPMLQRLAVTWCKKVTNLGLETVQARAKFPILIAN